MALLAGRLARLGEPKGRLQPGMGAKPGNQGPAVRLCVSCGRLKSAALFEPGKRKCPACQTPQGELAERSRTEQNRGVGREREGDRCAAWRSNTPTSTGRRANGGCRPARRSCRHGRHGGEPSPKAVVTWPSSIRSGISGSTRRNCGGRGQRGNRRVGDVRPAPVTAWPWSLPRSGAPGGRLLAAGVQRRSSQRPAPRHVLSVRRSGYARPRCCPGSGVVGRRPARRGQTDRGQVAGSMASWWRRGVAKPRAQPAALDR